MQSHPAGVSGFQDRANQFNKVNGKPTFQTINSSEEMRKEAAQFWDTVTNYEQCLEYYKRFKPEYPEALQVASAKYMTNLVEKGKSSQKIEEVSWDFMKEIEEIKQQVLASKDRSKV